jgi:ribosomal protein S18 acetylase RimI-like enzyme
MEIRPAVPQDAQMAAGLLADSMGEAGLVLMGLGQRETMLCSLTNIFPYPNTRYSMDCAWMAVVDGQPAGLLLAFPGYELDSRLMGLMIPMFKVYGLVDLMRLVWRSFPVITGEETEPQQFYIAQMAVLPSYRQRGIGTALLAFAEQLALRRGLTECSLIVEIGNDAARSLYLHTGYEVTGRHETPALVGRYHLAGHERMVKKLGVNGGTNDRINRA